MLARPEVGDRAHIQMFLDDKDPNEKYNWSSYEDCACGQYSRKYRDQVPDGPPHGWISTQWVGRLNTAARPEETYPYGTFGDLAEKWRKMDWNDSSFRITNPAESYSYSVGVAGSGGGASDS